MKLKKYINRRAKEVMFVMSKLTPKKNKAVFISFAGKTYSDNPKAISEKLHKASPNTEIVWIFNEPDKMKSVVPGYVRCVKNNHRTVMRELSDAKIWVNSFCFSPLLYKSKKQMYIHTWHADRPFKKVLFDRVGKYAKYNELFEQKNADYIITGSEFGEKMIRSSFKYDGELLKVGCPRNDKLFNYTTEDVAEVKGTLGIKEDVKILLYAPTFREKTNLEQGKQVTQSIDLKKTLSVLKEKYNTEWICLVRAHKSGNGICGITYDEQIIDVTDYQDMADMLMISDFLITDYSSSYSDFALKNAPAILYQDDRDSYLEGEREFYYDVTKTPFIIAQTQDELDKAIIEFDDSKTKEHCKEILDFYECYEDGKASDRVVETIVEFINKR